MTNAIRDENHIPAALGQSSTDSTATLPFKINSATGRLLTDNAGGGSGTVTEVSVVTANGFAGTVADATTTPAITLTTTVTGIVKGNGTAISAASAGTDYVAPGAITSSGLTQSTARLLGRTTAGSGAIEEISVGTGLTLSAGSLVATGVAASIVVGTTVITSGTTTRILYDNAGVLGEYTITGTGTVVAMATNPTLSGITMTDATNIVINTTTGTKIGTGTTQKIGFYNATPIVQPTGDVITALQNLGLVASATITASLITVANEGTDTTCFPVFVTAATGDLGPKSNAGLTFNSNTALLTATLLAGTTSVTSATIRASSNDSGSIGAAGTAFSDLYLASGALIDFANGNAVITHSSGILTVSTGDLRVTTAGTNSASVVTVGGTQTLTSKTLTSPTITTASLSGTQTLQENASIALDPAGSADGKYTGITIAGTAGTTLAFGDLVYLASADSRWELADADSATTSDRMMAMCVLAAANDGDPTVLLLMGQIRADAKFPALTIGSAVYVGETAGAIQVAIPTGADNVIRRVGYALTADEIYFNPSMDSQITVA